MPKGPDGLKPGDVIYVEPEVNSPEEVEGIDARAVVVEYRDTLGYVFLSPHLDSNSRVLCWQITDEEEWFRSQAEANEAAAAWFDEYGRQQFAIASALRHAAGG